MSRAEQDPQCSADFRLSITKALGDQLSSALQDLVPAPLVGEALDGLKVEAGVYQLYRDGSLVYIGKADKSLPDRLRQHMRKISGRQGISAAEMAFTCLYVAEDFTAVAPETLLIKRYQGDGQAPWNNNGFGNKDPGRNRDTTVVEANHFDAYFPINLGVEVELHPGHQPASRLLDSLKRELPYLLRYDKVLKAKSGIATTEVTVPSGKATARELFALVIGTLPAGWQLTALPGYAILYKESKPDAYGSALTWWRRDEDGEVVETLGRHLVETDSGTTPLETGEDEEGW